jgi:hypothetical protein
VEECTEFGRINVGGGAVCSTVQPGNKRLLTAEGGRPIRYSRYSPDQVELRGGKLAGILPAQISSR